MKIAFVNTEYLPVPPTRGGAVEEWIEKIAQSLKEHDIFVLSYDEKRKKSSDKKWHVRYFWFKPNILDKLLLSNYRLPFRRDDSKWLFYPYSLWCAQELKEIKPDVIHIHNRPHFVWIIKKLNPEAKIILHLHQVSAMEEKNLWTKELIASIDLFVGCSQFIVDEMIQRYGVDKSKTAVFYNGLDLNDFPSISRKQEKRLALRLENNLADKTTILYVGRLVENKGVHHLVQAVRDLIQRKFSNIKLVVCGACGYASRHMTPYVQRIYNIAYEVNENVFFTGFISHEKILDYYLMADLVVIPSEVQEGFCLVTIESMAAGVPVMATKRGGMPEIIEHRKTGIIVGEPSAANIEQHIEEFLKNPEGFRQYIAIGRKTVEEKFTWDIVSRNVAKVYMELQNA